MQHWLMKSEPDCFSIDDLYNAPQHTSAWDGVRNYQARNFMMKDMKIGDEIFFYHSSCKTPGIVGTAVVSSKPYPDFTSWDKHSDHFDHKSTPENPRWYMVDITFKNKFAHAITLQEIKKYHELKNMIILRKGNRLSITPITEYEWNFIINTVQNTRRN